MKILIVEDEHLAADRLKGLILDQEPETEVLAILDSVESAVAWLRKNPAPDLAFFDIQLADGMSFSVFEQVEWKGPVIFTTAYDEYALQAFRVNSVDYLLKPIEPDALQTALDKYKQVHRIPEIPDFAALVKAISNRQPAFKSRFLVQKGEQWVSVPVADILYFYSEEKVTFFRTADDKRYLVSQTLNELEGMLDPAMFFRLNRGFLLCHAAIEDIRSFFNRRLRIKLKYVKEPETVSRERLAAFRAWLGE